jgi:hypothetical protein
VRIPYSGETQSRRVLDKYGVIGAAFMILELALILFVAACLAAAEGARWLWAKAQDRRHKEAGDAREEEA